MNHLDYYKFQAEARGMRSLDDVRRAAHEKSYLYRRIVRPWLPEKTDLPIAELACGHGSFLHWLKDEGFKNVVGVDGSAEQIELARQVRVSAALDDVNHWLALQSAGHFAALVGIDLIEHLPKDQFMELLHAAHQCLAPGGSLILRLPNGDSPFVGRNLFNDITHVWTYTPNCLNSLAAMHGFSRAEFKDEGSDAIRDQRWLKVPLSKLSTAICRTICWMACREKIDFWSPHLWARLIK
jgi:2-polyprenyl-3-methyl-5-hydroxy-6-metoxy-1,4-benzoquinol methylase